ncbi:MAG: sugar phosphate isomerase/epimerase [Clostridia bacterium]|nr:sugar phosphate isomerase/epimerase [Clostridia bacterium]
MKKFKVGLQLYSIRDAMEKDMDAALKAVKEMGYDYVEFAGYFGKTAEEVKALLDKYGLECVSVHQAPSLFFEKGQEAIDYIKTLGTKYCAIPWYTVDEFINNWDETMDKFTKLGQQMKENGIQLLYHNHDFEFNKIDGEFILDKMYSTIPNELLQPQFDTCWVHYAGNNPAEYLKKYIGKIEVVHLKDFVCEKLGGGPVYGLIDADGVEKKDSKEDNGFKFMPVGYGIQDWPAILAVAEEAGAEIVIVEQDQSPDRDPLEAVKMSREYLKTLGL